MANTPTDIKETQAKCSSASEMVEKHIPEGYGKVFDHTWNLPSGLLKHKPSSVQFVSLQQQDKLVIFNVQLYGTKYINKLAAAFRLQE